LPIDQNELGRILTNPENVIMSDDLYELLDSDSGAHEESSGRNVENNVMVIFEKEAFSCEIKKVSRLVTQTSSSIFKFVLFVPTLPIDVIFNENLCVLEVDKYRFRQSGCSDIEWADNHLTVNTRRILK
jgi:hypothetical protein